MTTSINHPGFNFICKKMGLTFNCNNYVTAKSKERFTYLSYMYTDNICYLPNKERHAIRTKYEYYHFLDEPSRNNFSIGQRVYNAFVVLKNRWMQKRIKKYDCNEDLCGTPFDELPKSKVIGFKHYNCLYRFNIIDLFNILRSSLCYQAYMIPSPTMPKNPYINKEFGKYHLYLICLHCWIHKIKMPLYLHLFYKCGFNCEKFLINNRIYLSELAIDAYCSVPHMDMFNEITALIKKFTNKFITLEINREFPLLRLHSIFRPYLCLYYKYKLTNDDKLKQKLGASLKSFALFNPCFGKKFINKFGQIRFDDRCLGFADFIQYANMNESMFDMMKNCRNNVKNPYCVSLEPIQNVIYIENVGRHSNMLSSQTELTQVNRDVYVNIMPEQEESDNEQEESVQESDNEESDKEDDLE